MQKRLLIPLMFVLLLLVSGFSIVLLIIHQQNLKQLSQHAMKDVVRSLDMSFARKAKMLTALEDVLLHDSDLREALQAQDQQRLLADYGPIFQKLKNKYSITHFYLHRPDRVNLVRIHKPEKHGDLIDRFTLLEAEHSGKMTWGVELGPLGTFTQRVVQPVRIGDTLIGYLELGQEIEGILNLIHQRLGVELAVTINKSLLDKQTWLNGMEMLGREADWDRYNKKVLIYYSHPYFPPEYDSFVYGSDEYRYGNLSEEIKVDNKSWRILSHSLKDASGTAVGDLIVLQDITEIKAAFFQIVTMTASIALALLGGLFAMFYVMLSRTDRGIQAQQAKLAESEGRQRSLLDAVNRSGISLFVVDDEYRVRYGNESMTEGFGKVEGKICYSAVAGYDSPCSHCRVQEVIRNQKTVYYQSTLANGRSYDMIAVPYVDVDGTSCKLEVMQDITEKRQIAHEKNILEKKLQHAQKMEAIGLLAGGVAHDLNNILSGIVSYPELLLLKLSKNSELRKPLIAIQESGNRAAAVVDDLLTVARGVARVREPHDINLLVQEYLISPEYKKLTELYPNVTCRHQLEASHPYVVCSPVHIKKSLMNLVTNAAESIVGEGTVFISTHNQSIADAERNIKAGEYVVLSIRDTGSGISDEDLKHVFEPFYTKKVMGRSGTGLGLAVVWNTVEDHDGKIFVASSEKGTHFQLYFPVSNEEGAKQTENKKTEKLTGNKEYVLVVDDEPQLRDIASKMLRSMGYLVDSVCSGELAIEFVKKNPVDLILLDMLMEPGISGRQTYEEIIKLYPNQKAIVASGFSESEDVKATLRLGASGFMKKPYSMDHLGRAVKEALTS